MVLVLVGLTSLTHLLPYLKIQYYRIWSGCWAFLGWVVWTIHHYQSWVTTIQTKMVQSMTLLLTSYKDPQ